MTQSGWLAAIQEINQMNLCGPLLADSLLIVTVLAKRSSAKSHGMKEMSRLVRDIKFRSLIDIA